MRSLAVAAAFAVLALVHTYPLVLHLGSALPGQGLGDNVSFVWNLWWMREALASPGASFWFCPRIMAPLGASLALHTHTAVTAWLGATLLRGLSVVAAQNVLLLASVAFNGIAAYVLARAVGASHTGAALGGVLFELSPFVTTRLMGHYNLVLAWTLLLACAAFVRWWTRPGWTGAALAGAAAGLLAYADYYFVVYFVVFVAAYAVIDLVDWRCTIARRATRWSVISFGAALVCMAAAVAIAIAPRDMVIVGMRVSLRAPTNALTAAWLLTIASIIARWRFDVRDVHVQLPALPDARQAAVALAVAIVVAAPLIPPVVAVLRSGEYVTQVSSLKSGPRGVDLATLALGSPFGGLTGSLTRAAYEHLSIDPMESSAWPGLLTIVLLVAGWASWRGDRDARRWAAIAAVFATWALGPSVVIAGRNTGLLLPGALVHVTPIVNNARIPGRALIVTMAAASVLIALVATRGGFAGLRRRPVVLALLVVASIVDLSAAPLPLAAVGEPGVYRGVAADAGHGAVLPISFGIRDGFGELGRVEHDALFAQSWHRHALVGGFVARLPPRTRAWYQTTEPYATLLRLSGGEEVRSIPACSRLLAGLRAVPVDYVVVYRRDISPALRSFVESMPLEPIAYDGRRMLLKVSPDRCRERQGAGVE